MALELREGASEPITISATKKALASGALYADVMPAAAPHATSRRSCCAGRRRHWPSTDAHRAASCTMGPSRPIEPPLTMLSSEAALRATLRTTGMRPSPMADASM